MQMPKKGGGLGAATLHRLFCYVLMSNHDPGFQVSGHSIPAFLRQCNLCSSVTRTSTSSILNIYFHPSMQMENAHCPVLPF